MRTIGRTAATAFAGRGRGFTLLEMLLAVLVFSLMASAAYGVLNSMVAAAAAQDAAAGRLREVQLAVLRLERELHQTLSAGMFSDRDFRPGVRGEPEMLELGFLAPETGPGGPAVRQMQYRFEGGVLYRVPLSGDSPGLPVTDSLALLRGVSQIAFSYLDPDGEWARTWDAASPGDLPVAVRLDMEIERFGHLRRLFELPGDRP